MKLLIVTQYQNIFIDNLVKYLKRDLPDIYIDIYYTTNVEPSIIYRLTKHRTTLEYVHQAHCFKKYLRKKHYDIIHCHWLCPQILFARNIHKHCDRLFYTFWGGELEVQKILHSQKLYKKLLYNRISKNCTIANSLAFGHRLKELYPNLKTNIYEANYGCPSIDDIYKLIETQNRETSKQYFDIPLNKKSILIGYSGKPIHNHIPIIKELVKRPQLINKVHILVPMTRDADTEYITQIKQELEKSGFTFTLISGRFLTTLEIAHLRIATDIVIQMSDYDGFSNSIKECLSAGAIMIYGEWLNYDIALQKNGFSGIKAKNIKHAIDQLEHILDHYNDYHNIALQESVNGKTFSWGHNIKDWIKIYENQNI